MTTGVVLLQPICMAFKKALMYNVLNSHERYFGMHLAGPTAMPEVGKEQLSLGFEPLPSFDL